MRALPIIVLVLAVLAVLAGWLTTPRYRPPADSGEDRLRERALEYYKASRELDYQRMSRLFTPARQESEEAQLRDEIAEKQETYRSLNEETKQDLKSIADSITPDRLTFDVEGDWAVAGGTCDIMTAEGLRPLPLSDTVWVRDSGDWWLFSLKNAELNAYGNPPEFARQKLELRSPVMVEQEKPPS
jgi:hypothetical protein